MKIGICYNLVEKIERGTEIDKLSDNEIVGTVECVLNALEELGHTVTAVRIDNNGFSKIFKNDYDIIFNLCEGIEGNVRGESWFAGFLDLLGIPYTGSDSMALAMCLDKVKTKQILIANSINTPDYYVYDNLREGGDIWLNFPVIVKPSTEDASVGIDTESVVHDMKGLMKRVEYIITNCHQPALVEEYIDGRELGVPIIGNGGSVRALNVTETIFNFEDERPKIDSYESKWVKDSHGFINSGIMCPAELSPEIEALVKNVAISAYRLMNCRDYAMVDIRLHEEVPYVLEVNPNPGIGKFTGFVKSAESSGISYESLIINILTEAAKRYSIDIEKREGRKRDGNHISLTPVRSIHVPLLARWFNDKNTSKYMDMPDTLSTESDIIDNFFVIYNNDLDFIIEEKKSERGVGFCSLYDIGRWNQSAEMSFLIGEKEFRGRGYAHEAVRLLLEIAFNDMDLNRVSASVTEKNISSIKILEKLGFRKVGIMRQYHCVENEKMDEIFFEIIKEDFNARKALLKQNP